MLDSVLSFAFLFNRLDVNHLWAVVRAVEVHATNDWRANRIFPGQALTIEPALSNAAAFHWSVDAIALGAGDLESGCLRARCGSSVGTEAPVVIGRSNTGADDCRQYAGLFERDALLT